MNMIKYLLKLKYIIVFQVFTALLSIVGIASMPYVVKLLFDYDFSKGAGGMIWIVFLYLLSIALGMFFEYCSQRSVSTALQNKICSKPYYGSGMSILKSTICQIISPFFKTMSMFSVNTWSPASPSFRLFSSCSSMRFSSFL